MRLTIRSIVGGVAIAALIGASVTDQADAGPAHLVKLRGHVSDAGKAIPGSQVTVLAWPNAETLGKYKIGQTVPVLTVGYGRTDASGNFSFDQDTAKLGPAYSDAGGNLSLEVRVTNGATLGDYTTQTPRNGDETLSLDLHSRTVQDATTKLVPSSHMTLAGLLASPAHVTKTSMLAVLTPKPNAVKTSLMHPAVAPTCGYTLVSTLLNQPEYFAVLYVRGGYSATISEAVGSTRTTGIAVSSSGTNWASSGTGSQWSTGATNSANTTTISPTHYGDSVNYAKYSYACASSGLNNILSYELRPYSSPVRVLLDRSHYNTVAGKVSSITLPNCSQPVKNYVFTTGTSKTNTYTGGVQVGIVSLDSSSTWTKDVTISFSVNSTPGVMCFNNPLGLSSSTVFEVHPA
jgi:hypothetical protein